MTSIISKVGHLITEINLKLNALEFNFGIFGKILWKSKLINLDIVTRHHQAPNGDVTTRRHQAPNGDVMTSRHHPLNDDVMTLRHQAPNGDVVTSRHHPMWLILY